MREDSILKRIKSRMWRRGWFDEGVEVAAEDGWPGWEGVWPGKNITGDGVWPGKSIPGRECGQERAHQRGSMARKEDTREGVWPGKSMARERVWHGREKVVTENTVARNMVVHASFCVDDEFA